MRKAKIADASRLLFCVGEAYRCVWLCDISPSGAVRTFFAVSHREIVGVQPTKKNSARRFASRTAHPLHRGAEGRSRQHFFVCKEVRAPLAQGSQKRNELCSEPKSLDKNKY